MSRCPAASCQGQAGAGTQGPEVPRTRGGEGQSAGSLRWLESAGQDWGREKKAEEELWNPAPRFPQGSLPESPESHPWGEAARAAAEKQHRPGLRASDV